MGRSAQTGYGPTWTGSPHPADPDNLWIDDITDEVVDMYGLRRPETEAERAIRMAEKDSQ